MSDNVEGDRRENPRANDTDDVVHNDSGEQCERCQKADGTVGSRPAITPDCPKLQPEKRFERLCAECADERPTLYEQQLATAQELIRNENKTSPVTIAFFECGRACYITPNPEIGTPIVRIQCDCSALIEDVKLIENLPIG